MFWFGGEPTLCYLLTVCLPKLPATGAGKTRTSNNRNNMGEIRKPFGIFLGRRPVDCFGRQAVGEEEEVQGPPANDRT